MHLAAQNWHIEIVVLLINFRANVNARDNSGYTTLFWAAYNGHEKTVEFLIEKGANINTQGYYGGTPLCHVVKSFQYSQNHHSDKVIKLLIRSIVKLEVSNANPRL